MKEYDCPVCGAKRGASPVCEQCGWDFTTDVMMCGSLSKPDRELRERQLAVMRRNYEELMRLRRKEADGCEVMTAQEGEQLQTDAGTIEIREGCSVIGERAFENRTDLERIWMPDSVKEIAACAFCGCIRLRQIRWSKHLETIGTKAFCGCANLQRITLPQSVARIENGAFSQCAGLESVRLPAGLKKVGKDVFSECAALSHIETAKGISEEVGEMLRQTRL